MIPTVTILPDGFRKVNRSTAQDHCYIFDDLYKVKLDTFLPTAVSFVARLITPVDNPVTQIIAFTTKWDDCTDIRLSDGFHACSSEEVMAFGDLIKGLFNLAHAYMAAHHDPAYDA